MTPGSMIHVKTFKDVVTDIKKKDVTSKLLDAIQT